MESRIRPRSEGKSTGQKKEKTGIIFSSHEKMADRSLGFMKISPSRIDHIVLRNLPGTR